MGSPLWSTDSSADLDRWVVVCAPCEYLHKKWLTLGHFPAGHQCAEFLVHRAPFTRSETAFPLP